MGSVEGTPTASPNSQAIGGTHIMTDLIPLLDTATLDSEHQWTLCTRSVAEGYGVKPETIRSHKLNHADELVENHHWFTAKGSTWWSRAGVIRLGMFIHSDRAIAFRDAAEAYLMGAESGALMGALKKSTDTLRPLARAVAEDMFAQEFPALVHQEYQNLLADRGAVGDSLGKLGFHLPARWKSA